MLKTSSARWRFIYVVATLLFVTGLLCLGIFVDGAWFVMSAILAGPAIGVVLIGLVLLCCTIADWADKGEKYSEKQKAENLVKELGNAEN